MAQRGWGILEFKKHFLKNCIQAGKDKSRLHLPLTNKDPLPLLLMYAPVFVRLGLMPHPIPEAATQFQQDAVNHSQDCSSSHRFYSNSHTASALQSTLNFNSLKYKHSVKFTSKNGHQALALGALTTVLSFRWVFISYPGKRLVSELVFEYISILLENRLHLWKPETTIHVFINFPPHRDCVQV